MKQLLTYKLWLSCILLILLCSCGGKMNKRITLWRNDKIPYGTYYAYNNLHYFFKDAEIETLNYSPAYLDKTETSSAYIIIGHSVRPSQSELNAILNHIYSGNKVFISSFNIGENLLDSFGLATASQPYFNIPDSMTVSIFDHQTFDSTLFTYPGKKIDDYFTKMDSSVTNILGRNKEGKPNFIQISYQGGGSIMLHLAPMAFTNFFLLHKDNKKYYDLAMSTIPDTVSYVRWDDYFRHHVNGEETAERSGFSKLKEILNNDVLRWAFWLTLLLFGIVYLFESKRKQRAIPVIVPPANTSLDFVQTVGQLYFQRRDNKDMASKMTTHFLGYIRSNYNISTNELSSEFVKRLSFKSGWPEEKINDIIATFNSIENKKSLSDEELLAFNDKLEKFYKQT